MGGAKNNVTVTLTADESKLVSGFEKVGGAADKMKTQIKSVDDVTENTGAGFSKMEDGADTAERRFTGFYDTLGGTKDALAALNDESLSTSDKLIALGQAGADFAGGLADFVIPMISSVGQKLLATTAGQWALNAAQTAWNATAAASATVMKLLNAAFIASPIGWLILGIGALVTAFVILWNKSEGFRNFFIGMWNGIKNVVGAVVNWIVSVWNGIPGFFQGIVNTIGNIFSGIGNAIKNAFKSAINFVIDIINGAIWVLNKVIDGINFVPGVEIPHIPKVPRLHTGGVVPGMLGSEQLAILQAGERVIPRGQSGNNGSGQLTVVNGDGALASLLAKMVRNGDLVLS